MEKSKKGKKETGNKKRNFFGKSLQRQILIPFLSLIITAGIIIAFTNFTLSKNILIDEKSKNMESQMENLSNTFETFFINKENILNRFAQSDAILNDEDENRNDILDLFGATVESDAEIINAYTVEDTNGHTIIYPEADLGDDFDGTTRDWYMTATEAEGGCHLD